MPERLHSREAERAAIVSFLESHVVPGLPSSLYVSGAPGTGKTACLNCVLQEREVSGAHVLPVLDSLFPFSLRGVVVLYSTSQIF